MALETSPIIKPRSEHPISRRQIDPDALKVLYRLRSAGHLAYLVGGCVRDLLLGRAPKDFDIGTSARPEEVRVLFRNSRLIGRRFRLAHILFRGGKVVEVATFRGRPLEPEAGESADLLVTSDNTYGSPEEDAERRDFTINGLFYNIADFTVIDYVGGLADLDAGLVRSIGDPSVRFREDPVRMLRAVEFATRLSFAITPLDYEAILLHRRELARASVPRLTDELLAILRGACALPTFLLLREAGLLEAVLPDLAAELRRPDPEHPGGAGHRFWALLEVLDAERRRQRSFDEDVYLGVLALPLFRASLAGGPPAPGAPRAALAAQEAVERLTLRLALPNALTHRTRYVLSVLPRFEGRPEWKAAARRLVFHPDFASAADLAELLAMARGRDASAIRDWRSLRGRLAPPPPAPEAGDAGAPPAAPRRRRRRRRR